MKGTIGLICFIIFYFYISFSLADYHFHNRAEESCKVLGEMYEMEYKNIEDDRGIFYVGKCYLKSDGVWTQDYIVEFNMNAKNFKEVI